MLSKSVRANRRELRLRTAAAGNPTVDVEFDGHRVWSTKLTPPHPRSGVRRVPWPAAVVKHLSGTSTITVRNSADGTEIATGEVSFGGPGRVTITDAQGRWLALDKWNRLGPYFEGNASGVQGRLLASSVEVSERMQGWGYPVYIVGGTLLGAMRSGSLLPHDDDVDLAYLSDKSDPQDLSLESFELERQLTGAGYTVVRHSHAHLEIVFFTEEHSIDYYIDIFTGYFTEDGQYNQPFALRGKLARPDLVPTRTIDVNGVPMAAPATPEAWLEYAYGPNWRIPDPAFVWETPRSTLRRFENSFGVFNRQRVFWEKTWQEVDKRADSGIDDGDVERFLRLLPPDSFVVDLGCGDGRYSERIAAAGHQVLGVDYSFEALRVARQTQPQGVDYQWLNLNDRHQLLNFGLDLVDAGKRPYFFARNLLHEMQQLGRTDVFVMLRGVLDADSFMYATFDATPVTRVAFNPETWTLTLNALRTEAWRWKLGVTALADRRRKTPFGTRTNVTTLVWN